MKYEHHFNNHSMGMFLSLSGVIGKTHREVVNSLANYARSVNGGLRLDAQVDDENCCIIKEVNGNTTVFYPSSYAEWEQSSEFLSQELQAPVFSFHIHDGDLWMYTLYVNGTIADQFNPVPDYWDDLDETETANWKGNAAIVAQHVPGLQAEDIEKYLVRWNPEAEEPGKAYPDDEFATEDWQLLDFMKKLNLPYPVDEQGYPRGQIYTLWTKELRLEASVKKFIPSQTTTQTSSSKNNGKPWWKFW